MDSPSSSKSDDPDSQLKAIHREDLEQELARFSSLTSALQEARDKKRSLELRLQNLIQPLMDSPSSSKSDDPDSQLKAIHREDLEQELARFSSLTSALQEARDKKRSLELRLQNLIQGQADSLSRVNELEEMRERMENKKAMMGNMVMQSKVVEEHSKTKEEHLSNEIKALLVSGTALTVARKRLQDSTRLVDGERGIARLKKFQKMLRARQQLMVSQVAHLYPVKTLIGPAQELELDSFPRGSRPGTPNGSPSSSRPRSQGLMTISGLQLSMLPFTQMSIFGDKKQAQKSATALGYVAHCITLVASYLKVPLRYPVRLGGSHSYIRDYAQSVEPFESSSNAIVSGNPRYSEFPLFVDGQDATRATYAVFLLNKDIEQLLNYVGLNSIGPRQLNEFLELTRANVLQRSLRS
ncbi:hypothetical protein V2J09_024052 [Rumex salicifolius]